MLNRKFAVLVIVFLVLISTVMFSISYKNQKSIDENLEWGFPFIFYYEPSEIITGSAPLPVSPFSMLSLIADLAVYLVISIILVYAIYKIKDSL